MADVNIEWLQVKELPTLVSSWHDIKYYAGSGVEFPTERCVYCIRLAPPFMIHYDGPSARGSDDDFVSPLIYVGSGNAKGRLGNHLGWLKDLGQTIPLVRYEVWIAQPKVRNNKNAYASFEGYLLHQFEQRSRGWLPLRNKKKQAFNPKHEYGSDVFEKVIGFDRRYNWAIWPYRGKWNDVYNTGGVEKDVEKI